MTNHEVPVQIRRENAKTVVDIEADNVDFRNAEMIKSLLADLVQKGDKELVLNLRHVNFMDSSGLSVLLSGKRVAEEAGGSFSICGLQGYVNNLINLTNLNKTIAVYPTDMEALKS
jgi:anti-sigma B factor antagonist